MIVDKICQHIFLWDYSTILFGCMTVLIALDDRKNLIYFLSKFLVHLRDFRLNTLDPFNTYHFSLFFVNHGPKSFYDKFLLNRFQLLLFLIRSYFRCLTLASDCNNLFDELFALDEQRWFACSFYPGVCLLREPLVKLNDFMQSFEKLITLIHSGSLSVFNTYLSLTCSIRLRCFKQEPVKLFGFFVYLWCLWLRQWNYFLHPIKSRLGYFLIELGQSLRQPN